MLNSYIFIILTIIPVFAGIITFKKYQHTFLKYFLVFLIYSFITEVYGYYTGFILRKSTFLIYNIYLLISVLFYSVLTHHYIKRNKILILLLAILFLVFSIVNVLFIQKGIKTSQTNSFMFGAIIIALNIIILFYNLLKSDAVLQLNKMLLFWIGIGTLLFWIGIIPIEIMGEYLNYKGIFNYIILALNIIMYGSFTIGFLVTKKQYNT